MPARSINPLMVSAVVETYLSHGPSITVKRVSEIMAEVYGDKAPSERKIQDILRDHKAQTAVLDAIPRVNPLGEGWPTNSDDVHYLGELENLLGPEGWDSDGNYPWTEPKILAALECKGLFGFPDNLRQFVGTTGPWGYYYPANPFDLYMSKVPAQLVLVEEIANRRVLAEAGEQGDEPYFDDLYDEMMTKSYSKSLDPLSQAAPTQGFYLDRPAPPIMFFRRHGLVNKSTLEFHRRARKISGDCFRLSTQLDEYQLFERRNPGASKETIEEERLKSRSSARESADEIKLRGRTLLAEIDEAVPISEPTANHPSAPLGGAYAAGLKRYVEDVLTHHGIAWETGENMPGIT